MGSLILSAQETEKPCLPVSDIPPSKLAFASGEKITLMASYTWGVVNTDVGTVSLELDDMDIDGEPGFQAKARLQTLKFFSAFFKVDDYYESHFKKSTHFNLWKVVNTTSKYWFFFGFKHWV